MWSPFRRNETIQDKIDARGDDLAAVMAVLRNVVERPNLSDLIDDKMFVQDVRNFVNETESNAEKLLAVVVSAIRSKRPGVFTELQKLARDRDVPADGAMARVFLRDEK